MHIRETFSKFFADRGTHLAAMIAYFALLSFVPLIFLALALLGLGGRTTESSYFVEELEKVFPSASVSSIVSGVDKIRRNATSLGLIGGAFLLWSSLSLFSVLESAFNIVYDRPNRSFLHGKARATLFMLVGLVTLFVGLLVGGVGAHTLDRFAPGFLANTYVAHGVSVVVSSIAIFLFLIFAYRFLTNVDLTLVQVLPGSDRRDRRAGGDIPGPPALPGLLQAQRLGSGDRRTAPAPDLALRDGQRDRVRSGDQLEPVAAASAARSAAAARPRCELTRFQSSPSSATVRVSPSGTNTGS